MRLLARFAFAWLCLSLAALGVGAIEAIASTSEILPSPGETWGGLIGIYMAGAFFVAVGVAGAGICLFGRSKP